MANRYWVGGSGTWNTASTTNWSTGSGGSSGASAPTAADTVIFDNNSNVGTGAFTVTVSAALCLDMTFGTGASALDGTMTLAMGTSTLTVSGSWTNPSTNFGYSGTGTITFNATTSKTITTNGIAMVSDVTFDGVGGTWQLQDAMTTSSTKFATLTNGTLNLNNLNLTCGAFSSNNSNTRTLAFGTGQIYVTGSNTSVIGMSTVTGLTITGTPLFNSTYSGSTGTRTCNFGGTGGSETVSAGLNITAGTDTVSVLNSYRNISFSGFAGTLSAGARTIFGNLTISSGMTLTAGAQTTTFAATSGTKTITTNGVALDINITFNGVGGTWQLQDAMTVGSTKTVTLTNGALDLFNKNLTTGLFNTNNTNTRTLAFGTGQIYLTGTNATIWNSNSISNCTITGTPIINATGAGTAGQTRTFANGAAAGGSESTSLILNITTGSDSLNIGNPFYSRGYNFTGFSGTLGTVAVSFFVFGDITFSSSMTVLAGSIWTIYPSNSTANITSNGITIDCNITCGAVSPATPNCVVKFVDALTLGSTRTLALNGGTLQLPASLTTTVGAFTTSGTALKYLRSTTTGTQATISDASGTNTVTYLDIQDSNATGGATFDATATTNVNSGNNSGWNFGYNGNFFFSFS